jgi:hypothetical protein
VDSSRIRRNLVNAIEILESRIAPAVTIALLNGAPNFAVIISDDASGQIDNRVEIQLNAASELEYSLNGGAFTNDLDSATPGVQSATIATIQSIAANLGSGSDTFIVSHGGGLVNPSDSITFDGGPGPGTNEFVVHGTSVADTTSLISGNLMLNGRNHILINVDDVTFLGGEGADSLTLGTTSLPGGLVANAETIVVSGTVTTGGNVTLAVDLLDVQQAINAGSHRVSFEPMTPGRPVNLGSENAAHLSVTNAELAKVTAGVLQIGGPSSGAISVSAGIFLGSTPTLRLATGAGISGGGSLTVSSLRIDSTDVVTLTGTNDVTQLAAQVSGAFSFTDIDDLKIAEVDGLAALSFAGIATISASLSFDPGASLAFHLGGATAGAGHDQLLVNGSVNLVGAALLPTLAYAPASNDHLIILSNDGTEPVLGKFAGLEDGATLTIDGVDFTINYYGGDGNDVVLRHVKLITPTISKDGKVAKFIDVDGDRVKITTTHGAFTPDRFRILEQGVGGQLQLLDLRPRDTTFFNFADVTITARPTALGGDGLVNVGLIDAYYTPLHNVRIAGDLGTIVAGDTFSYGRTGPFKRTAVNVLNVQSLGAMGISTQDDGGNLKSNFYGTLGKLVVRGDIRGAALEVRYGDFGAVDIRGSFIGGSLATFRAIGSIHIGNDVIGTAASPVVIYAYGARKPLEYGRHLAIGSFVVGGDVEYLKLLAANVPPDSSSDDGSIGLIRVEGDWRASTAIAGVSAGPDGFEGTADDRAFQHFNRYVVSQIAKIVINGTVSGSSASGDSFGIMAEEIVKARIGGLLLPLTSGEHSPGDFFALGDTGPGPTGIATDFVIGEGGRFL